MRALIRPPAGGTNNVEATDQLCGPCNCEGPGDAGGVRPLPPRGHATPGKSGDSRPCAGRILVICEFVARRVQHGIADHAIKELCRIYVSRSVKCEYCGNQRSMKA